MCKSTLQAGRALLSGSRKAYQEPVLHLKHIWGDFQSCFFFLLIFHIHLLVSFGRRNVTYSLLHRNTGAAWCRCCLQREIPVRFSSCRRLIVAASATEFLNGWLRANLPGSFIALQRNYISSFNLCSFGSGDNLEYTSQSEVLYGWNETFLAVFISAALSHSLVPE